MSQHLHVSRISSKNDLRGSFSYCITRDILGFIKNIYKTKIYLFHENFVYNNIAVVTYSLHLTHVEIGTHMDFICHL